MSEAERNLGSAMFPGNFKVTTSAALDARLVVDSVEELTKRETWPTAAGEDGAVYIYKGMIVSVTEDSSLYMLTDPTNYDQMSAWKKLPTDETVKNIAFNPTYNRIEVTSEIEAGDTTEDATFILGGFTKLEQPSTPTISSTYQSQQIVTGNATVYVTNTFKSSVNLQYCIKDKTATSYGAWTSCGSNISSNGAGSFSFATNYSNSAVNTKIEKSVKVKSIFNGVESEVGTYNITIVPKVASMESNKISVVRSASDNNEYGTKLEVKVSRSATTSTGVKNEYSTDGGTTWTEFTSDNYVISSLTTTTTESTPKDVTLNVRVRATSTATDYAAATPGSNTTKYTIGAKKLYYGFSTKTSLTEDDIKALATTGGGGKISGTKPVKNQSYTIKPTNFSAATTGYPYIWICTTGTLTPKSFYAALGDPFDMGFNDKVTFDGWNCYRLTASVTELSSDATFVYIS